MSSPKLLSAWRRDLGSRGGSGGSVYIARSNIAIMRLPHAMPRFLSRNILQICAAPDLRGKPATIIPTTASEDLFFYDPDLRNKTRKTLRIEPGHRLFVYSGSLLPYQCFDETVELFVKIQKSDPTARLLVLTPDIDSAVLRLSGVDKKYVIVRSAALHDINMYLNAADAAFMLRRMTAVNAVALPTKFAEYCLTGLPVIMTDGVMEACAISAELGNRARPSGGAIQWPPVLDRANVARNARALLGKQHFAPSYVELYQGILGSFVLPRAR